MADTLTSKGAELVEERKRLLPKLASESSTPTLAGSPNAPLGGSPSRMRLCFSHEGVCTPAIDSDDADMLILTLMQHTLVTRLMLLAVLQQVAVS